MDARPAQAMNQLKRNSTSIRLRQFPRTVSMEQPTLSCRISSRLGAIMGSRACTGTCSPPRNRKPVSPHPSRRRGCRTLATRPICSRGGDRGARARSFGDLESKTGVATMIATVERLGELSIEEPERSDGQRVGHRRDLHPDQQEGKENPGPGLASLARRNDETAAQT